MAFLTPAGAHPVEDDADEAIRALYEKGRKDAEKADEMFTSKLVEGVSKDSPEVAYWRKQVELLRTKVEELQLRSRPVRPDWLTPPAPHAMPAPRDPNTPEMIYLNNGTLKKARAIRERDWVYFGEQWYPLAQIYRGMDEDGTPIYVHPDFPWPHPPAKVTETKDGKTVVSLLGAAPYGRVPYDKIPKGHRPDLDLNTGRVRYLVPYPDKVMQEAEQEAARRRPAR